MIQTTETPQPTNAELVAQVVGAVTAVQDAEAVLVEGAKKLADHIADPNAHGRDVAACIAQAVADHDGNTGAHAGTFVKSDDVRLSDARTPKPHKATHGTAGSDPISPSDIGAAEASHTSVAATASVLGHVKLGTVAGTACEGNDARLVDARTPIEHKATHQTGGTDALTPADIGAAPASHTNVAATASVLGHVKFGTTAGTACEGNDARLSDARTPTAHTHTKSQLSDLGNATDAAVGLVRGDGVTTTVSNGAMSVIASVEATANSIVKRDASGNIVGNITGHATWADLAEVYRADGPLEEGDVVRVSPDDGFDVARAVPGSPVLGVVSLRPGVLLNCGAKDEPLHYAVARVGIVPVKVFGPVAKGARLTAGEDGKAVASPDGTGFAFANENKRDEAERLVMCIL